MPFRVHSGLCNRIPICEIGEKYKQYVAINKLQCLSKAEEAALFLKNSLKDGPLDSREIKRMAKEAGISMPTINRVKKEAGVVSRQQSDRSSLWSLES